MERTGWGQRIVQFFRWKPNSYKQVWLFAVLGFGVPAFIIWSVVGVQPWPIAPLLYAVGITFFGGLGQRRQLNRRRQQGR